MALEREDGQTAAEYLGGLLVVALIIALLASGGVGSTIAGEVERLVCEIGGGECGEQPAGAPVRSTVAPLRSTAAPDGPPDGPAIPNGPLVVLPFPGSFSVTCGVGDGSERECKSPDGAGVRVKGSGTVTAERSDTSLDGSGCPQQTLSLSTTLQLEYSGTKERGKASGELAAYIGTKSKYAVTVSPDQAENIEQGGRRPPNPLDPRTLARGESVQMSKEFYEGLGLSGDYGAMQAQLGYEKGRRVSSGVTRVDAQTVRVYVGDDDFVRHALAVGVGNDDFGADIGFEKEISDGKLRAIDIDVSTAAGWEAYQRFVTSGRLPDGGTPGTTNPTDATTRKYSDSAKLEGHLGDFKLGGQFKDAEGNYSETRSANGDVERNLAIRYNDLGLEVTTREDARGNPTGERTYALNLQGVDPDRYSRFQELNFGDPTPPPDGNVRWEFSGDDLMAMRTQALEQLAHQMELRGADPRPTADEVAENLERNHGVIKYGPHDVVYEPEGLAGMLANARTPEEVLESLYRIGGGDPNTLLAGPLTEFVLANAYAAGEENPTERGRLPGDIREPRCGR